MTNNFRTLWSLLFLLTFAGSAHASTALCEQVLERTTKPKKVLSNSCEVVKQVRGTCHLEAAVEVLNFELQKKGTLPHARVSRRSVVWHLISEQIARFEALLINNLPIETVLRGGYPDRNLFLLQEDELALFDSQVKSVQQDHAEAEALIVAFEQVLNQLVATAPDERPKDLELYLSEHLQRLKDLQDEATLPEVVSFTMNPSVPVESIYVTHKDRESSFLLLKNYLVHFSRIDQPVTVSITWQSDKDPSKTYSHVVFFIGAHVDHTDEKSPVIIIFKDSNGSHSGFTQAQPLNHGLFWMPLSYEEIKRQKHFSIDLNYFALNLAVRPARTFP